jgi:hypothetical protein
MVTIKKFYLSISINKGEIFMRIALCFYGLVGGKLGKNGRGESLDPTIAYEYYKEHIIDVNDEVDVFIHSWSADVKDKLVELYKPKKECIEKQIYFPKSVSHPDKYGSFKTKIKLFIMKLFKNKAYNEWLQKREQELFRVYSRWYSSKKVLELKKEYEKENRFKYDVVMITRLDIGFFTNLDFTKYDMKYFYASNRNKPATKEFDYIGDYENYKSDTELSDLWFFSNTENMDKFADLYNEIVSYEVSPHRSSRQHVNKYIGQEKIAYTLFRWFDCELIRRKEYGIESKDEK